MIAMTHPSRLSFLKQIMTHDFFSIVEMYYFALKHDSIIVCNHKMMKLCFDRHIGTIAWLNIDFLLWIVTANYQKDYSHRYYHLDLLFYEFSLPQVHLFLKFESFNSFFLSLRIY